MERNKYPYLNIGKQKETKNIRINIKDNISFTSDLISNETKKAPTNTTKEKVIIKDIRKNLVKNDTLKPSQSCSELNSHPTDKKAGLNTKKNTTSFIEEKRIKYIPNKSKNRSMEKVPSSTIGNNKKDWKRNKNDGDKHNSCGKNSDYNKYNKTDTKKKIRIDKKNFNTIEYNNIDDLQNININEEQSIKNRNKNKKNNYLNYIINDSKVNNDPNLITKSDLDDTEDDNPYSFQEYNSFCVRINNNYNYNVSLGNNTDFINQTFDQKKNDLQIKNKGKESEWKEKITKINKQKNDISYGDYKKYNSKDINNSKKTKKIGSKEEKNVTNKSLDNNNTSLNLKQKIKKLNSAVIPGENDKKMNASDTEASSDKKNEPKKHTGILWFLRSFKDMVKPFNMRKKTNYESDSDSSNNNSIESSNKIEIKEKANKSENNTIINENKKKRNIFNFLNSNEKNSNIDNINTTSKKSENNKPNVYEKKSLNKKPEDYNYYSDSGYESSPLPHKPKNLNVYSTPNINIAKHKNIYEKKNNQQILSYSQKNIIKLNNNYNNENDFSEGKRSKQNSDIADNFKTEEKPKGNSLFNFYGIFNNKLYQKTSPNQTNNKNNLINEFYRNNINIPKQLNDSGYNSAYAKKTKKIYPSINNNNDINSEKEMRKYSFHNNTAYNLNNIDRDNVNNPTINEANDYNKYNTKNIEENLNINAEKKIQEIKININYKRDNNNFNNTLTPIKNQKANYNYNNTSNNYDRMDDFIATPKAKSEIETCVINFKQNKKPMKVYENNLYNNINNNINDQNLMNNNNFSLYKNNTNIKDTNKSNSKNIYSKPMGKNLNFSQGNSLSEKNIMEGKKENILSFSDTNIAINRNNFDSPKPSLKKNIIHQNERIVNRLANSQQFDNDTNSNSSSSDELNKTTIFPSSNITNSIYFKPFKYFFGGNKNKTSSSANNSFNNTLYKKDKINDGNLSDREGGIVSGLNKIIYFNKRNKTSQLNNNENNTNQNSKLNPEQIIYKKSNSNKNNNFKINLLNNSNKNNSISIHNTTPMEDNTNCNVNNIKTIIRPKVIQKKNDFIEKYYSYYLKKALIETEGCYYSKEFIKNKIFKLPLKKISFYTKSYYKIIQKPKISQHYIDKKRITYKAISLPISKNCILTKVNIIEKNHNQINDNKYSTPNQKKEKREQNLTPKFMHNNQNNSSNSEKNKIISIEIDLNNKNKYVKKNKDPTNEENANVSHNLGSTYNKIHLNTNANEPLYIKKTQNNNVFKQNNNNINNYYVHTEDDNFKTYLQERMNDNLKINKFFSDDFNINNYSNRSTNNKIISIDIDLRKEQKKLQEQKEIKTYKKPTTQKPLIEQNQNLKNKINTIKINLNKNSTKNNNIINKNANNNINDNKYANNLNIDKLKQEIIYKLDIIEENNLMIVMDELIDLLTKKVIINNINDNINLSKIRLSFIEIINNSYLFVEIIINKAISETKKLEIFAKICYEMSMRLNNEISIGRNGTNEDLKTILQESCKIKFEEILSKDINIEDNKNSLLGILMFICELINYKIIFLDTGFLCFEKLCNKYYDSLYENGKLNKYYYLDLIINLFNKIGKNAYQIKDLNYKEKMDNYIDNELNNLVNNDMGLPQYLRNKIINLIKTKTNNWNF